MSEITTTDDWPDYIHEAERQDERIASLEAENERLEADVDKLQRRLGEESKSYERLRLSNRGLRADRDKWQRLCREAVPFLEYAKGITVDEDCEADANSWLAEVEGEEKR